LFYPLILPVCDYLSSSLCATTLLWGLCISVVWFWGLCISVVWFWGLCISVVWFWGLCISVIWFPGLCIWNHFDIFV
jgi:hypothetical protein